MSSVRARSLDRPRRGSDARPWLRPSEWRLAAVALAVVTLMAMSATARAAFVLPVTGPADAPRMVFNSDMKVDSICLPVTNPAGGQSILYGQQVTDGPATSATPAIVLVHGIASSTEDWDFSSTWSAARALASAGYVVYSYDRLGYAQSSYFSQPGGGDTLTTQAHRARPTSSPAASGSLTTATSWRRGRRLGSRLRSAVRALR
ncbi:MAG TPA: hypothetical protein VIK04_19420 [Solirubrobacteraceae bacterium]